MNAEVEFELADNPGQINYGSLVNISGKGVLFATKEYAATGIAIKIAIPWLRTECEATVTLHIIGDVVRTELDQVGIRIAHAVFRTNAAAEAAKSAANTRG